ncbi:MAG TPA: tRNA (guanosine(37)-N1)-methyltransferase TrmD [Candidatus Saccharimonadales bacterium]|nr:tRNA (guanosine(37)-N1)-methyltransferase TrmD [Candidatus Saccharimonadales bacterium]
MKIQVITLFPEMFEGVFGSSMLWKAQDRKLVEYSLINLRDFGQGTRKQVDDVPYGGGDGMVLMAEPLFSAIDFAKSKDPDAQVLLMTPRGDTLNQEMAREFAATQAGLIIVCGRYEGYDERIISVVDKQISVGDYVLTGGELPAMIIADAVTRLIPGVLGGETSAELESFSDPDVKEHPHYTRPEEVRGLRVPDVLLSGHHAEIKKWRDENSIK